MQIQVNNAEKDFQPIEMTIKFETLQEVINIMSLLQCNGHNGPTVRAAEKAYIGESYGVKVDPRQLVEQMGDLYYKFFPFIEKYQVKK